MSLIEADPSNDNPSAGDPNAGEQGASGGDNPDLGEPGKADDRQTAGALLERRVQGVVDENIHLLQSGETEKMNPKLVELLTVFMGLQDQAKKSSQVETGDDGLLNPVKPARNGGEGGDQPSDADIGKQTRLKGAHDQVMKTAEQQALAELWLDDAKSFFTEIKGVEITTEEFEVIDVLNTKLFPRTKEGYRKWRQATNEFLRKHPLKSSDDSDEESGSNVDADRETAGKGKKPPTITGSRAGIKTLAQAARMQREGKLSDKEYLAEVARFSQV